MVCIDEARTVLERLSAVSGTEWVLLKLDEESGRGLVISKDIVQQRRYNDPQDVITWEICQMRAWLNSEYYASLPQELRDRCVDTVVSTPDSCAISGGKDTVDKLFLLSIEEYEDLLPEELRAARYHGEPAWWWLRSPGYSAGDVADVYPDGGLDGGIGAHGFYAFADVGGVRPAMCLDLMP